MRKGLICSVEAGLVLAASGAMLLLASPEERTLTEHEVQLAFGGWEPGEYYDRCCANQLVCYADPQNAEDCSERDEGECSGVYEEEQDGNKARCTPPTGSPSNVFCQEAVPEPPESHITCKITYYCTWYYEFGCVSESPSNTTSPAWCFDYCTY